MIGTVVGTFINKVITYHQGPGDHFQNVCEVPLGYRTAVDYT